ncbi:MAG TPA: enoyl-CoA hydratase-related protein [Rhodocyclaceae bacterium]|nr:enoyl-CoA hydratase-related protein [Rhodocyclaceae bacterium]
MSAVLYETRGPLAVITLNRPGALNALNHEMIGGLAIATARAGDDPNVRVVLIRGGGDHFMAGGDLKWFREEIDGRHPDIEAHFQQTIDQVHASTQAIRNMDKPVIAVVHGAVAGFGLSLMLACDFALAADNAYFTLAYCHIGLSPDGGATWLLPRLVGLRKASELALLGERFDAGTAATLGLVNRVVPLAELNRDAEALAARLAAGPAAALARTKALLQSSFDHSLDQQLAAEKRAFAACAAEPDFAEGLAAFAEKRKARFV